MTPAAAGKFEPRVGPTEKRCAQCAHLGPICVRLNSADDKTAGPLLGDLFSGGALKRGPQKKAHLMSLLSGPSILDGPKAHVRASQSPGRPADTLTKRFTAPVGRFYGAILVC